jgi:hypothetical protein
MVYAFVYRCSGDTRCGGDAADEIADRLETLLAYNGIIVVSRNGLPMVVVVVLIVLIERTTLHGK